MASPLPALGVLVGLLCAALVWDVTLRQVPSVLAVATALAGLGVRAALGGVPAVLSGLAAGAVIFLLLGALWSKGRLAGGDVKLATAAAASVGLGGLAFGVAAGAGAPAALLLLW